jgi:hypothetical protein
MNVFSSLENGGLTLLFNWKRDCTLIQVQFGRVGGTFGVRMNGTIVELLTGSLHFVGVNCNCEAHIEFEDASIETSLRDDLKTLKMLLKNGDTLSLSEDTKPIPE